MSTLEISLVCLVIATLGGVIGLNVYQSRRARGDRAPTPPADLLDVRGGGGPSGVRDRVEPVLADFDAVHPTHTIGPEAAPADGEDGHAERAVGGPAARPDAAPGSLREPSRADRRQGDEHDVGRDHVLDAGLEHGREHSLEHGRERSGEHNRDEGRDEGRGERVAAPRTSPPEPARAVSTGAPPGRTLEAIPERTREVPPDAARGQPRESSSPMSREADRAAAGVAASARTGPAPAGSPRTGAATGSSAAPVLDELADCIQVIELPSPVSGERLLALTQGMRRAGAKPIAIEGMRSTGGWEPLAAGARYDRVRIGVLLANRHGALNAMEFSEFVAALQALAQPLGVRGEPPDMTRVLERARDLDSTCVQLDAQIGVNIETRQPLGIDDLALVAQAHGLVERGNNRYALLTGSGVTVFSLSLADAPNRLTLLLDVPRCPEALRPWQRLVDCAKSCASRLDGRLIDDAGRALPDGALSRIGDQLSQRYRSLEQAGFPAGSPLALRLFN